MTVSMKKLLYTWYHGSGFIHGASPEELVGSLRKFLCGEDPGVNDDNAMEVMARHCYQIEPSVGVRFDSVQHFVYDLIDKGFIMRPIPVHMHDVLDYAQLYIMVALPEYVPANWAVLTDLHPIDNKEIGLRVRVRGEVLSGGIQTMQLERIFTGEELADASISWQNRVFNFAHRARYGD